MTEGRKRKTEDGARRTEDIGQRIEDTGQRADAREQRTTEDDRGRQRTEDGAIDKGQRTEDGHLWAPPWALTGTNVYRRGLLKWA